MRRGRVWTSAAVVALTIGAALAATVPAGAGNGAFIQVVKEVGENAPADATFEILVECEGEPDQTVPFDASGGSELVPIDGSLEGECTFTETETSGATPSYACEAPDAGLATCIEPDGPNPAVVDVNDPGTQSAPIAFVTVTNTFEEPTPPPPEPAAIEAAPTFTG